MKVREWKLIERPRQEIDDSGRTYCERRIGTRRIGISAERFAQADGGH